MSNESTQMMQQTWTEISDPAQLPQMPHVSVLMLTYNHGPYLAEAIEGVVNQKTDFPIELLIGEDCSTDDTLQVAREYQKRYPQIVRVLHGCPNGGVATNFSRLIQAARGEYAAFCEGDDYWIDTLKLTQQVKLIRGSQGVSIVHADHVILHNFWGQKFIVEPRGRFADHPDKAYLAGDISEKCFGGMVTHTSTVLCRSRDLKKYLETELIASPGFAYDRCVVNYLALQGHAAYLDIAVSAYRITPGSLMRSGAKGDQKLALEIRDFFLRFSSQYGKYADRREVIYKHYTIGILKSSFKLRDFDNFNRAIQELNNLSLETNERLTVKWLGRLFNIPTLPTLFIQVALSIQAARRMKRMVMIYIGMVERTIIH